MFGQSLALRINIWRRCQLWAAIVPVDCIAEWIHATSSCTDAGISYISDVFTNRSLRSHTDRSVVEQLQ